MGKKRKRMFAISPLSAPKSEEVPAGPRPGFRAPAGLPTGVTISPRPYTPLRGNTTARDIGLRFERKVQFALKTRWGEKYWTTPEVCFYDLTGKRVCFPDGVYRDTHNRMFVFEIKFRHCPEAWWQLRRLYLPVIGAWAGADVKVFGIEICRTFDPETPFPEKVELLESLDEWIVSPEDRIGVFRWTAA